MFSVEAGAAGPSGILLWKTVFWTTLSVLIRH
jgi:hypothetical protein